MGQIDRLHAKIFDAMHKDKRNLANAKVRAAWLQENGVAVAAYDEMAKSFTVATKLDRARQLMAGYRLDAVPRFVVQGRYVVAPEEVGLEALFPTLDRLAASVRAQ